MKYKIIDRIKLIREEKGLSQVEFSLEVGITNSAISLYESHKDFPSYKLLTKLLTYCEIDINHELFANKLRGYRINHVFTTRQLCQLLDINFPQLCNVLNNKMKYSMKSVLKICYELHFDIYELLIFPE